MKNKKLLVFLFLFVGLLFLSIDGVRADSFTIEYKNCTNLENKKTTVTIGKETQTEKCTDSDFLGWYVSIGNDYYCVNTGDLGGDCGDQGRKIYRNGAKVSETGNNGDTVTFTKVTRSNADTFTVSFDNGVSSSDKIIGNMPDQLIVIGYGETLNKNQFVRENYDFNGWYVDYVEKKDGSKEYICGDGSYKSQSNDCADSHSKRKKFFDGQEINQTGYKNSIVHLTATWTVSQKNLPNCISFNNKDSCETNRCSWNKEHNFCSIDGLTYLKCGDAKDIPEMVPRISSFAVNLLKTVTPIVLIVMSIISLVKAITAGKEDEIKKAQGSLIKRVIIAVIIFFVIVIVQFIMLRVAHISEKDSLSSCLSCFLNGTDDSECSAVYYKDGNGTCYYSDKNVKGNFACD